MQSETDINTAELDSILSSLPEKEILKIYNRIANKSEGIKPQKQQVFMVDTIHEYHCEMCASIKTKVYKVKITSTNPYAEHHRRPHILYTVCNKCRKALVLGIAVALTLLNKPLVILSMSASGDEIVGD